MRLIDADKFKQDEYLERRYGSDFYWEFRKRLDAQPTVEDKPQGKWIEYKPEHGKCPFCGNTVDLLDGKLHRYCGECGTKMGEEQE